MSTGKPLVILAPAPHGLDRIFTPTALAALESRFDVVHVGADDAANVLERHLPEAFAIIGQPPMDRERIERAGQLRALLNVEGNFFPNVDYEACYDRGVYVLGCGPAYAQAVAEFSLGLALDLARGISREDRAFREGRETYIGQSNHDAILLRGADVGLIGFGNLGRALRPLLRPFETTVRVFDPWLPDGELRQHGVLPCSLDDVLASSQFVFVLATVTEDSEQLLGARELELVQQGARIVVVSRAPVVDFDALLGQVGAGRFLAGVDVWPDEPVPPDYPARSMEGLVLSAHRAGGIPAAFLDIGDMVLDDLTLLARGLPPVRMQVGARELVGRYRNRPVS